MSYTNLERNITIRVLINFFIISSFFTVFFFDLKTLILAAFVGVLLGTVKIWATGWLCTMLLIPEEDMTRKRNLTLCVIFISFILLALIIFSFSYLGINIMIAVSAGLVLVYFSAFLYTIELLIRSLIIKSN